MYMYRVFQLVVRGGENWEFYCGGIFSLGKGNLRMSNFGNSNLFQS